MGKHAGLDSFILVHRRFSVGTGPNWTGVVGLVLDDACAGATRKEVVKKKTYQSNINGRRDTDGSLH